MNFDLVIHKLYTVGFLQPLFIAVVLVYSHFLQLRQRRLICRYHHEYLNRVCPEVKTRSYVYYLHITASDFTGVVFVSGILKKFVALTRLVKEVEK